MALKVGFCYKLNTFIVLPLFLLWTVVLLLMGPAQPQCHCESKRPSFCDMINAFCWSSSWEVLSPGTPVIFRKTVTEFTLKDNPLNFTHFTSEQEEKGGVPNNSHFLSWFWIQMVLHLAVLFLQTYFLQPNHHVVQFAKDVQRLTANDEKLDKIRKILPHGPRSWWGVQILITEVIALIVVYVQLFLTARHMHDVGSRQLLNWFTGEISMEQLMHNGFPLMANCRVNGESLCPFPDLSCSFIDSHGRDEMINTCLLPFNYMRGVGYIYFYIWAHIFAILLTARLIITILFLSMNCLRKGYFMALTRGLFYNRDEMCFDLISKKVSPFEALYLLRLNQLCDFAGFKDLLKVYFKEV